MPHPTVLPSADEEDRLASRAIDTDQAEAAAAWLGLESLYFAQPGDEGEFVESEEDHVELPCQDKQLTSHDAMLLNSLLMQQVAATHFSVAPPSVVSGGGQTRPLYDWFVHALNVAPLCDALLGFLGRLAAWKRSAKRSGPSQPGEDSASSGPTPSWPQPRELQV